MSSLGWLSRSTASQPSSNASSFIWTADKKLICSALDFAKARGYSAHIRLSAVDWSGPFFVDTLVSESLSISDKLKSLGNGVVRVMINWKGPEVTSAEGTVTSLWVIESGDIKKVDLGLLEIDTALRSNKIDAHGPSYAHLLLDILLFYIHASKASTLAAFRIYVSPSSDLDEEAIGAKHAALLKVVFFYESLGWTADDQGYKQKPTLTSTHMTLQLANYRTHFDLIRGRIHHSGSARADANNHHSLLIQTRHDRPVETVKIPFHPRYPATLPHNGVYNLVKDGPSGWRML